MFFVCVLQRTLSLGRIPLCIFYVSYIGHVLVQFGSMGLNLVRSRSICVDLARSGSIELGFTRSG